MLNSLFPPFTHILQINVGEPKMCNQIYNQILEGKFSYRNIHLIQKSKYIQRNILCMSHIFFQIKLYV